MQMMIKRNGQEEYVDKLYMEKNKRQTKGICIAKVFTSLLYFSKNQRIESGHEETQTVKTLLSLDSIIILKDVSELSIKHRQ